MPLGNDNTIVFMYEHDIVLLGTPAPRIRPVSLKDCRPGDVLEINHRCPGAMWSLPRLQLIKAKVLDKGGFQIKWRDHHSPTVIHKTTIPEEARVYRVIPLT